MCLLKQLTLTQLCVPFLHWIFLPCVNIWEIEHMLTCSLTHTLPLLLLLKHTFPPPGNSFIILSSSSLKPSSKSVTFPTHMFHFSLFMSKSSHHNHPFNCFFSVSSIPLSLHVPSNYRAQYHSYDRLSISSICPDYSLKIKKIAMDQSK